MNIKNRLSDNQKRSMYWILDILPTSWVVNLQYYGTVGRKLNLKNPERFTEKIQWYKINYQIPLMTICADKYKIREYVREKGLEKMLPELYGVYDTFSEINFARLPNSFAVKSNNGSGTNIFIEDKNMMDYDEVKKTVNSWGKVNTLSVGREWAYKNIEPKIIIEELLIPEDEFQLNHGLTDYKILCFNGKAKYIWVDVDRDNNHQRNFYSLNWEKIEVKTDVPNFSYDIKKPAKLALMLELAETIAKDFPFVRVDYYYLNNKLYLGELTFYPWSGSVQFTPDSFDYHLGALLVLPEVTKEIK